MLLFHGTVTIQFFYLFVEAIATEFKLVRGIIAVLLLVTLNISLHLSLSMVRTISRMSGCVLHNNVAGRSFHRVRSEKIIAIFYCNRSHFFSSRVDFSSSFSTEARYRQSLSISNSSNLHTSAFSEKIVR